MNRIKLFLLKSLWTDPDYEAAQMSCPTFVIEQVDQTLYDSLLADATASGAQFDGSRASVKDCEFDWNYDAQSQSLSVTCLKKPMLASCGFVESQIRELVEKSKSSGGI